MQMLVGRRTTARPAHGLDARRRDASRRPRHPVHPLRDLRAVHVRVRGRRCSTCCGVVEPRAALAIAIVTGLVAGAGGRATCSRPSAIPPPRARPASTRRRGRTAPRARRLRARRSGARSACSCQGQQVDMQATTDEERIADGAEVVIVEVRDDVAHVATRRTGRGGMMERESTSAAWTWGRRSRCSRGRSRSVVAMTVFLAIVKSFLYICRPERDPHLRRAASTRLPDGSSVGYKVVRRGWAVRIAVPGDGLRMDMRLFTVEVAVDQRLLQGRHPAQRARHRQREDLQRPGATCATRSSASWARTRSRSRWWRSRRWKACCARCSPSSRRRRSTRTA